MSNRKILLIVVPILLTILAIEIIGFSHIDRKKYYECLEYTPDTNWVEEDLEPIFMTTGVCVLDTNDEGEHIYYTIRANGFYYKVHYAVSKTWIANYRWKYQNHIQINYV